MLWVRHKTISSLNQKEVDMGKPLTEKEKLEKIIRVTKHSEVLSLKQPDITLWYATVRTFLHPNIDWSIYFDTTNYFSSELALNEWTDLYKTCEESEQFRVAEIGIAKFNDRGILMQDEVIKNYSKGWSFI